MAEDKNNSKDTTQLPKEEMTRAVPKTDKTTDRDRVAELPATTVQQEKLAERIEAANEVANQTIDEGNENEVQGKAAVPHVEVMKRGSTKWTDEDGVVHKELNDAQPNADIAEGELPQYLKLHQEVLNGADPLEATLEYQGEDPADAFQEGKLANAEEHPRTAGSLGVATRTENVQKEEKNG